MQPEKIILKAVKKMTDDFTTMTMGAPDTGKIILSPEFYQKKKKLRVKMK